MKYLKSTGCKQFSLAHVSKSRYPLNAIDMTMLQYQIDLVMPFETHACKKMQPDCVPTNARGIHQEIGCEGELHNIMLLLSYRGVSQSHSSG